MSIQDSELLNKEVAAVNKLTRAIEKTKNDTGRDPRGGGYSFVANADYLEQMQVDLPRDKVEVREAVIIGDNADIAFWYDGIPVRLRTNAAAGVHLMSDARVPTSLRPERRDASAMRMDLVKRGHRPLVYNIDTGGSDYSMAGLVDGSGRPIDVPTKAVPLTDADVGRIVASHRGNNVEALSEATEEQRKQYIDEIQAGLAKVLTKNQHQPPTQDERVNISANIDEFLDGLAKSDANHAIDCEYQTGGECNCNYEG